MIIKKQINKKGRAFLENQTVFFSNFKFLGTEREGTCLEVENAGCLSLL